MGRRSRLSVRQPLINLTGMIALWCGLLAWRALVDRLDCPVAATFIAWVAALMALSAAEVAFYRRRAFVSHYLAPDGRLFRLLSRKILMILWQGIKSLLLAVVLLVAVLNLTHAEWLALLADTLLMVVLVGVFSGLLGAEVRDAYRLPMARHWALRVNAASLWTALVLIQLFSAHEDYSGLRWEEVAVFGASQLTLGCDALAVLARLAMVGDALALWAGQNLLAGLERPAQALMAWLVFLASFGVSFLLAWAYSRALVGVLSRPWRVWRE